MNAEDELSDMEISDDDSGGGGLNCVDDNGGGGVNCVDDNGGGGMKVNYCVDDDDKISSMIKQPPSVVNYCVDDDDKILSMIKQPPSVLNEDEEFETWDACLVEIDGHKLKKKYKFTLYRALVEFCYNCRRKGVLMYFSCPGQKDVEGGITSWEGRKLEHRKFCYKIAKKAITKYNRLALNKDGKLKLEKLMKVNTILGMSYYMTLSAVNKDTGKSGIYQAALFSRGTSAYVLGLFRDWSNDKILAILSITGAEEDLAAIRKVYSGRSKRS